MSDPMTRVSKRKRDLSTPEGLAMAAKHSNQMAIRLRRLGVGGRVVLSDEGRVAGMVARGDGTGTITGFGHHQWTVSVRPSHRRTSSAYHVDFWEPAPKKRAIR